MKENVKQICNVKTTSILDSDAYPSNSDYTLVEEVIELEIFGNKS